MRNSLAEWSVVFRSAKGADLAMERVIQGASRPKEIVDYVRYYLEHEQECEAISESGYEAILGTHQLESRLQTIIDDLILR